MPETIADRLGSRRSTRIGTVVDTTGGGRFPLSLVEAKRVGRVGHVDFKVKVGKRSQVLGFNLPRSTQLKDALRNAKDYFNDGKEGPFRRQPFGGLGV